MNEEDTTDGGAERDGRRRLLRQLQQDDGEAPPGDAREVPGEAQRPDGEVRAAEPPFWWETSTCGTPGVRFANSRARDVVYPRDDDVARALAERVAAIAWPAAAAPGWLRDLLPAGYGTDGPPRVSGLDDDALLTAVRARLPLVVIAPMAMMFDRLCMSDAPDSLARELLTSGWRLTPALDARTVLVHRPGLGSVTADAFGRIRIDPR